MNVLVTGVTGMIGAHLANRFRALGYTTFGIARTSAASRLQADPDASVLRCDVLDRQALRAAFTQTKPDVVVHLAAQAFNGMSWNCEESTLETNISGTVNVLNCCREIVPKAKVMLACSSAEYGMVPLEECPIKEDRPLRPVSPYGVSKVATECLGLQYWSNYNLQVYLPRLFIHVGTGHPPATAIQNLARQLALISAGRLPPVLKVGVQHTQRDFVDVRDGVEALILILERGVPGRPINVCTGTAHKISDVLQLLLEISGLKIEVVEDPSLMRPSDEPILLGDNSRLKQLGWEQRYALRQTLEAVYQDWLSRV